MGTQQAILKIARHKTEHVCSTSDKLFFLFVSVEFVQQKQLGIA